MSASYHGSAPCVHQEADHEVLLGRGVGVVAGQVVAESAQAAQSVAEMIQVVDWQRSRRHGRGHGRGRACAAAARGPQLQRGRPRRAAVHVLLRLQRLAGLRPRRGRVRADAGPQCGQPGPDDAHSSAATAAAAAAIVAQQLLRGGCGGGGVAVAAAAHILDRGDNGDCVGADARRSALG